MRVLVAVLVALLTGFAVGRYVGRPEVAAGRAVVLTRIDTVVESAPAPVAVRPAEMRVARLKPIATDTKVADSTAAGAETADTTVAVEVPITQAVYAGRGYRAYVSGWQPRLDSIILTPATTTVTIPAAIAPASSANPRRFSIGLQAGYGITPSGPQPYLGLGISLRIL